MCSVDGGEHQHNCLQVLTGKGGVVGAVPFVQVLLSGGSSWKRLERVLVQLWHSVSAKIEIQQAHICQNAAWHFTKFEHLAAPQNPTHHQPTTQPPSNIGIALQQSNHNGVHTSTSSKDSWRQRNGRRRRRRESEQGLAAAVHGKSQLR